jgi:flagellar biosynthesis/type III secretory pathway protein FliH
MASEVLMTISRDEVERARLMSEFKYEIDTQSKIGYARKEGRKEGREEGRKEGRKEGRMEGRREGREEGREEGRAEGEAKSRQQILDLLAQGVSAEELRRRLTEA